MKPCGAHSFRTVLGIVVFSGIVTPLLVLANSPSDQNEAPQITTEVIPLDIWFGEGKAVLKRGPHNMPVLKTLTPRLASSTLVHVEIEGSPDPIGDDRSNQALSLRRAEAMRATLAELYRIPPERIQADWWGESTAVDRQKPVSAAKKPHPVYVILYKLEPGSKPTQGSL